MGLSDIDEDDVPPVIIPTLPAPGAPRPAAVTPPPTSSAPVLSGKPVESSPPPPPAKVTSSAPKGTVDFDDLFGEQKHVPQSPPPVAAPAKATVKNDPLDSLFSDTNSKETASSPVSEAPADKNGIYVGGASDTANKDDLMDFSRPAEKKTYANAESFLDAFENMGKKGGGNHKAYAANSLENLTRNKDDNKIKARLLALMNYYDVLGVSSSASEDEIRRAYKRKALELHPDRVGRDQTPEEAELFKTITKAHEVLTDDAQKRAYDAKLRQESAGTNASNGWWDHLN